MTTIIVTTGILFLLFFNLSKSLLVEINKSDSGLLISLRIFGFALLNSSLTFEIASIFTSFSVSVSSANEILFSLLIFSLFIFSLFFVLISLFSGFIFLSPSLYNSNSNLFSFICKLYLSKRSLESKDNLSLKFLIKPFIYISPGNWLNSLFSKAVIYLDTI